MGILLLLFPFIVFFLIIASSHITVGIKLSFVYSVLLCSALIVLGIESASFFFLLNFKYISGYWLVISLVTLFFLFVNKRKVKIFADSFKYSIQIFVRNLSRIEILISCVIFLLLTLLFIQGIVYPPNNWDSMTYHMPRVYNWMSHQSLENYPTHVTRQLYQPLFCEYVICHINILCGNDYFSNSVQYAYLLFLVVMLVLMIESLGLPSQHKKIGVVLILTIPGLLLEATTTQNDLVHSFFILSSVYFAIKAYKECKIINFVSLGFSLGLSLLTKAIAYLYAPPICLLFGSVVIWKWMKTKDVNYFKYSFIALLIMVSVNIGHSYRNYQFSNSIIGTPKEELDTFVNHNLTPLSLVSTVIKNIGLHNDCIFIGDLGSRAIEKMHLLINANINQKGSNYDNLPYQSIPSLPNFEDTQPNFLHIILILISNGLLLVYLFKRQANVYFIMLAILVILQFLLFCYYLSWEPWHSRLHIPLFLEFIPIICYCMNKTKLFYNVFKFIFIPILLAYSFFIILFNYARPYITSYPNYTSNISIYDNRYKKYFAEKRPGWYEEYNTITKIIKTERVMNVGYLADSEGWEYPLFCKFYNPILNPIHINVQNHTSKIPFVEKNVDCIISLIKNDSVIFYKKKHFKNKTPQNKFIWFYK